ncbi:MAG: hypothetical protein ABI858_01030 [Pseudoxanthomonas sp.]
MRDPTKQTGESVVGKESNPCSPKATTRRDVSHDQQLLRDVASINARMLQAYGPVPAGGLPTVAKLKPIFPTLHSPKTDCETKKDDAMKLNSLVVAASLALTACAPMSESPNAQRNDSAAEARETDSPSLRHKFRVNPNPRRRYDITMMIEDAPGPFGDVGFGAQYDAPDCMYWTSKFAGTTSSPMRILGLPMKKLDDNTYVTTVYLDAMLDEDYYGDGVCHWQLTGVTGGLKATGSYVETGFGIDISPQSIATREPVTKYFWKERYPREEGYDNFPDFGSRTLEKLSPDKRSEYFSITMDSNELQP